MGGFYDDNPSPILRFGDVITGFQLVLPQLHTLGDEAKAPELGITITKPRYFAVMTPCCSIEDRYLGLAPLITIRPSFYQNPYFAEDFTRINRFVAPQNMVPPQAWTKMPEDRRQKMLAEGDSYTFIECFVYAPHDRLEKYAVNLRSGPVDCLHYLIDYKSIFRVNCNLINRGAVPPPGVKLLQLSIEARTELRNKLSVYFGRVPDEDKAAV